MKKKLLGAATVVGPLLVAYLLLPWLGARALPPVLAQWDITVVDVELGWPGWRSVAVPRLTLAHAGGDVRLVDATVHYRFTRLLAGRIDTVSVRRVDVVAAAATDADTAPLNVAALLGALRPWNLLPLDSAAIGTLVIETQTPPAVLTGGLGLNPDRVGVWLEVDAADVPMPLHFLLVSERAGDVTIALTEAAAPQPVLSLRIDAAGEATLAFAADVALADAPLRFLLAFAGWQPGNGEITATVAGRWPVPPGGISTWQDVVAGEVDGDWAVRLDAAQVRTGLRMDIAAAGHLRAGDGAAALRLDRGARLRLTQPSPAGGMPWVGAVALEMPEAVTLGLTGQRVDVDGDWRLQAHASAPVQAALSLHATSLRGHWDAAGFADLTASGRFDAEYADAAHGGAVAASAGAHVHWTPGAVAVEVAPAAKLTWSQPASPYDWHVPKAQLETSGGLSLLADLGDGSVSIEPAELALQMPTARWGGQSVDVGDGWITLSRLTWDATTVALAGAVEAVLGLEGVALAPLRMAGAGQLHGAALAVDATLDSRDGGWALPLQLAHDLDTGRGSVAGAASWRQRSALLRNTLQHWTGGYDLDHGDVDVTIGGRWSLDEGDYQVDLHVGTQDALLRYDDLAFHGVTARFDIALDPVGVTIADAPFSVAVADLGFPVTDIAGGVALAGGGLAVRDVSGGLLGGRFRIDALDFDLARQATRFMLDLEALELAEILLLHGDDIRGSGVLDGRIPVVVDGSAVAAADGQVQARPPGGRINYADAAQGLFAGQPGLDFALRALGDFTYSQLEADVDYDAAGTLTLAVRLLGRNPTVEGGRPIQYNLQLTQSIPDLLRSLQLSERLEEQIERHLQR